MRGKGLGLGMVIFGAALAAACADDAGNTDAGPEIDAPVTTGTVSLSWSIADTEQNVITCEDVGAVTVGVTLTPQAGGAGTPEAFPCTEGSGTTSGVEPGLYRVRVTLRATVGELAEPTTISDVEVVAGGDTPLGDIAFEVLARGNFDFQVDTTATGGNCDDEDADGAAITEVLFELRDQSGTCVPTDFEIAAGAEEPAGTYSVDCTTRYACIENDQDITVTGIPSGTYDLSLTGFKGDTPCWVRAPQFVVPANDLTTTLGTQQLTLQAIAGCDPTAPDAGPMNDAGSVDAGDGGP